MPRRFPPSLLRVSLALGIGLATTSTLGLAQEGQARARNGNARGAAVKETEGSKKLWGALVFAVSEADAKRQGFPDADPDMSFKLGKAFPEYSHFQVLGTRSEALFKSTYSWVAPSKQLCVKFDSKGLTKDGEGVKLDLQLWSQGKAILKTDAILEKESPVFMEGPRWGQGRLLYVLKLKDGTPAAPVSPPDAEVQVD